MITVIILGYFITQLIVYFIGVSYCSPKNNQLISTDQVLYEAC